jgi:hypothetical protein
MLVCTFRSSLFRQVRGRFCQLSGVTLNMIGAFTRTLMIAV